MNRDLLYPITKQQIQQYEDDGVVCIRGQFDRDWIDRMLAAGVSYIDNPCGPKNRLEEERYKSIGFISGTHMWGNNLHITRQNNKINLMFFIQ